MSRAIKPARIINSNHMPVRGDGAKSVGRARRGVSLIYRHYHAALGGL